MTSKAARRRIKKARGAEGAADPFAIAPVPAREASGRISRIGRDRDPAAETLKARCRQMGKDATKKNIWDMRAPWWGCNAGRAMATAVADDAERAELWDAICYMRRAVTSYDAVIGAPHRHAVCLRLLVPVPALEADAQTPPLDERTPQERQVDAVATYMRVEGWLGWADRVASSEAKRAVWDDAPVGHAGHLVAALRCVADGMFGRAMVYRRA